MLKHPYSNSYRIVDEKGDTVWIGDCLGCVKKILRQRPDWNLA